MRSLFEQEISNGIGRQLPVEAGFGDHRNEISHDDKHESGRCDRCRRSADLAVLKPRGRNEKDSARRDLTTERDEAPRIEM